MDDPWQARAVALLNRRSDLMLIGFGQGGRDAWIYELQPRPLGQLGPALLRQTVLVALGRTYIPG